MHWPFRQFATMRNLRHTALYSRLKEAGACFGEVAGWERPNWFANPGQEPKYEYSVGRQNWFDNAAAEAKQNPLVLQGGQGSWGGCHHGRILPAAKTPAIPKVSR
jgi:hypothetical protein